MKRKIITTGTSKGMVSIGSEIMEFLSLKIGDVIEVDIKKRDGKNEG